MVDLAGVEPASRMPYFKTSTTIPYMKTCIKTSITIKTATMN